MFQKIKRKLSQDFSFLDSQQESGSSTQELTAKEIQLVRTTWSLLRNDLAVFKFLGAELLIRYFTKYPDYQQKFKSFKDIPMLDSKNDLKNPTIRIDKKLMAHGTYVMYTIGMLVDNLENPAIMEHMLKRLSRNHYRRKISLKAFEKLRDTMMEQLFDHLGPILFNKKTMIAWRKTFGYLLAQIEHNFHCLESDIHRVGSFYRLNDLQRNFKHDLFNNYRHNHLMLDYYYQQRLKLKQNKDQMENKEKSKMDVRNVESNSSNSLQVSEHIQTNVNQSPMIEPPKTITIHVPIMVESKPTITSTINSKQLSQPQKLATTSVVGVGKPPLPTSQKSIKKLDQQMPKTLPTPTPTTTTTPTTSSSQSSSTKNFLWKTFETLKKAYFYSISSTTTTTTTMTLENNNRR